MQGRLLLGLLVLALVPALVGVMLASVLIQGPDTSLAAARARQTSTAAADLLMRAQGIEVRLAALASDSDMSRLASSSSSATRQLARRSISTLRGADGSIVAGACVARVSDGRMTVIAEDRAVVDPNATCAQGAMLDTAARASTGTIVRSHPRGTEQLLVATPIAGRGGPEAVLSAAIDLETLLERTPWTAATTILVDLDSSTLVAGASRSGASAADAPQPIQPADLAIYTKGILSGYEATGAALARVGWETSVADIWPTVAAAGIGMIQAWPTPASPATTGTWLALFVVSIVALIGSARAHAPPHRALPRTARLTGPARDALSRGEGGLAARRPHRHGQPPCLPGRAGSSRCSCPSATAHRSRCCSSTSTTSRS